MKATDKQLIDISEELTAHIMKPTSDLHLNHEECIILNRLISEEFERRQEQDVMGSSNGQDTPLGQTGADNNDGNINASECRDNEASGTSLREKKKPQITKVSKKEYWDNRDKHGTYIGTYFETYDMTDQPEEITQLDDLKDTDVSTEIKVSKGAMSIDAYKLFGQAFDEKCFRFNGVPLLDKYIPVAWMRERIEFNSPYADSYRKVIDSWNSFGKDLWCQNIHYY